MYAFREWIRSAIAANVPLDAYEFDPTKGAMAPVKRVQIPVEPLPAREHELAGGDADPEVMAAIVAHERPSEAARVSAIIERATERRKGASHAFEQIEGTEETITELWLLRFGAADEEGGGP